MGGVATTTLDTLATRYNKRTSPSREVNYTSEEWNRHKSPYRHFRHLSQVFSSSQFQRLLFPDLAVVFSIATALTYYNTCLGLDVADQLFFGDRPGTVTGAVALLAGFRTSSSYGRYKEARGQWGDIANASRDLARLICGFVPHPQERDRLLRLVKAYPIALNFYLTTKGGYDDLSRDQPDFQQARYAEFEAELLDVAYNDCYSDDNDDDSLITKDLARILNSFDKGTHTPLQVLTCLSEGIAACQKMIDPYYIREMEGQVQRLGAANGERILRTPIPTGFTRHTSRLLGVCSLACPFMIYSHFGVWTPLGSVVLIYSILAIEDIGVVLEEPFHVLPLRQYSDGIADAVNQIAETHDLP
jgi:putative membrane protein